MLSYAIFIFSPEQSRAEAEGTVIGLQIFGHTMVKKKAVYLVKRFAKPILQAQ